MEKCVAEILDGYSIAFIKDKKIDNKTTKLILSKYEKAIEELKKKYKDINWEIIIKSFICVNETIWKYEAAIRQGLVDDDPLIVYTRAILVREFNAVRVGLGNTVSALMKQDDSFNIKKDHVSE